MKSRHYSMKDDKKGIEVSITEIHLDKPTPISEVIKELIKIKRQKGGADNGQVHRR